MGKLEEELTPEQIKDWATKDFVISETSMSTPFQLSRRNGSGLNREGISFNAEEYSRYLILSGQFPTRLTRFPATNKRRIGVITGVNSDGSYRLKILGNDTFNFTPTHSILTTINMYYSPKKILPPLAPEEYTDDDVYLFEWTNTASFTDEARKAYAYANLNQNVNVTTEQAFMYLPQWQQADRIPTSIMDCGKYNNIFIISDVGDYTTDLSRLTLTKNDDTLVLGNPINANYYQRSMNGMYFGDKNIGGNLFDLMSMFSKVFASALQYLPISNVFHTETINGDPYNIINAYPYWQGSYAYHYTPYNLILTYSISEAQHYIDTGELPSDAFLYPFDVDNIPINEDGGTGAVDSDGTVGNPEGEGEITGDGNLEPTELLTPGETPQSLTNNNLYWLTSQQLKSFLDWFWGDATDIASANDLWDKITGAYENLSQAIVAVRYMPVESPWIGGVTIDPTIKVGMLEKEEQVQAILKAKAPIRDIGKTKVERLKKSLGWWINYTPYAQAYLYLPFFGYLDLDINLIMNKELAIRAVYDILSGTIQYFIFVGGYDYEGGTMINTVCAKMATDIPISLQTKTERDSAIFSNVSGVAATLIGGGVSAAAGNPIGMVMSTANLAATQPQGAPMSLKGNISESGAFYDCGKPVIYIKRPQVNIPNGYPSHIGYPCNAYRTVGSMRGFFKCENPYIHYKSGSDRAKPTYEEMEEIYNALSNGVYMLDN